jgi:Crp-like helix-turn-helix domain
VEQVIDQSISNRLLAGLPLVERQTLLAEATLVELAASRTLSAAGQALSYAYFPTSCVISLQPSQAPGCGFEVGMIGFEGMHGAGYALGVPVSAFDAVVKDAGYAWRIETQVLASHALRSQILGGMLTGYAYVQNAHMANRAVCCQFHSLLQRLSNSLLMIQDRLRSDDLLMTHDMLSQLLGARRAGITEAAGELQKQGLIRYYRGHILVLDRPGLAAIACGCYEHDLATYEGIMGRVA